MDIESLHALLQLQGSNLLSGNHHLSSSNQLLQHALASTDGHSRNHHVFGTGAMNHHPSSNSLDSRTIENLLRLSSSSSSAAAPGSAAASQQLSSSSLLLLQQYHQQQQEAQNNHNIASNSVLSFLSQSLGSPPRRGNSAFEAELALMGALHQQQLQQQMQQQPAGASALGGLSGFGHMGGLASLTPSATTNTTTGAPAAAAAAYNIPDFLSTHTLPHAYSVLPPIYPQPPQSQQPQQPPSSQAAAAAQQQQPPLQDLPPPEPSDSESVLLYSTADDTKLSPYQCLARQQLEFFKVQTEDLDAGAQGRCVFLS